MMTQKVQKSNKPKTFQLQYIQCLTVLGQVYLLASSTHILGLTISKDKLYKLALKLAGKAPKQEQSRLLDRAKQQLMEYLSGNRKLFRLPIKLEGSNFQKSAWKVLSTIHYGKTISYSEQATIAANPKAIRAIGTANAKNPLPIIIPCHRVTAKGTGLGGYSLGIAIKQKLLALEKRQIN